MEITTELPTQLGEYVTSQVDSGCYANAEDVLRDAVRHHAERAASLEMDDDNPALAAALLAGVRSPKHELN